jgi:hypothetical protein
MHPRQDPFMQPLGQGCGACQRPSSLQVRTSAEAAPVHSLARGAHSVGPAGTSRPPASSRADRGAVGALPRRARPPARPCPTPHRWRQRGRRHPRAIHWPCHRRRRSSTECSLQPATAHPARSEGRASSSRVAPLVHAAVPVAGGGVSPGAAVGDAGLHRAAAQHAAGGGRVAEAANDWSPTSSPSRRAWTAATCPSHRRSSARVHRACIGDRRPRTPCTCRKGSRTGISSSAATARPLRKERASLLPGRCTRPPGAGTPGTPCWWRGSRSCSSRPGSRLRRRRPRWPSRWHNAWLARRTWRPAGGRPTAGHRSPGRAPHRATPAPRQVERARVERIVAGPGQVEQPVGRERAIGLGRVRRRCRRVVPRRWRRPPDAGLARPPVPRQGPWRARCMRSA